MFLNPTPGIGMKCLLIFCENPSSHTLVCLWKIKINYKEALEFL